MCMRFEQPVDRQPLGAYVSNDGIGGFSGCASSGCVEVENAVNDGGPLGRMIMDDVAGRISGLIEKAHNYEICAGVWREDLIYGQGEIRIFDVDSCNSE